MSSELDRIDFDIIDLLQKNGRLSNKELAAHVGLAPSTTHGRVARIEQSGVIRNVTADVEPSALGIGLQVLVFVRLVANVSHDIDDLWKRLLAVDEVIGAFNVGGDDDLILHVAVRDTEHLGDSVLAGLAHIPEIRRVRTEILFRHERTPLPRLVDP